jgi:hypothetical protein
MVHKLCSRSRDHRLLHMDLRQLKIGQPDQLSLTMPSQTRTWLFKVFFLGIKQSQDCFDQTREAHRLF